MRVTCSFCLAMALLIPVCFSQESRRSTSQDEARAAIESSAQAYTAAYNSRDAEKLSELWSEKAIYILPGTGEQLVGRQAIRKMFTDMFAAKESTKLFITIDSIRFVTDDVAVETGTSRMVEREGKVTISKYSAINVKQNDRWLIESVSDTEVAADASGSGPLDDLEWMIGEWVDASADSTIETVCQWTKNKSFLTRTFRVSAPNTEDLEGTQVIGWDPINRAVRSWVFDSDGGFSEGSWTKKGTSWVVESTGFTSDGEHVASIQVFSGVDADSFHWQSFGRRVGKDRMPDIAEIKVVRKN